MTGFSEGSLAQQRTSRERRLLDGVKLLPFVGLALWYLPLVWSGGEGADQVSTAHAGLFIFAVWMALILLGAALSRSLRIETPEPEEMSSLAGAGPAATSPQAATAAAPQSAPQSAGQAIPRSQWPS